MRSSENHERMDSVASMAGNLVIRADAGEAMGTGHVMRCLALAQAWQDSGGFVTFVTGIDSSAVNARLKAETIEVVHLKAEPGSADDARKTGDLAHILRATWIVVDGYRFGADYQKVIKDSGAKLLFIDDYGHAEHYLADLILNQNLHAAEYLYESRAPFTRLLLGTRYALLRREFWKWKGCKRDIAPAGRRVLVSLGGSDPENITPTVIQALKHLEIPGLEATVIVGATNPRFDAIEKELRLLPFTCRLLPFVRDMPELMAWADVAVSAGGSTCWELAAMGLPGIIVVTADNQLQVAEGVSAEGAAVNLGNHAVVTATGIAQALTEVLLSTTARWRMSQAGRSLVDAEGALRVVKILMEPEIRLREACENDCRLIWEWANDPEVRGASFSQRPIAWEDHVEWFKSKLKSLDCIYYVALNEEGRPFGQIRYDLNGNEAAISVSLDRKNRGRGRGSNAIRLACLELFGVSRISAVHAYVKKNNAASIRAFVKAGFKDAGTADACGQQAVHLILCKSEAL